MFSLHIFSSLHWATACEKLLPAAPPFLCGPAWKQTVTACATVWIDSLKARHIHTDHIHHFTWTIQLISRLYWPLHSDFFPLSPHVESCCAQCQFVAKTNSFYSPFNLSCSECWQHWWDCPFPPVHLHGDRCQVQCSRIKVKPLKNDY